MKGAFIVSTDDGLYEQIERVLVAEGGKSAPDRTVQVRDATGTRFTVFGDLGPEFAVDLAAGADEVRGEQVGGTPAYTTASSCWVECGSAEVFVDWVRRIAEARSGPTWVLDGDGVLWTPVALDPLGVRL